jgi:NitT/TauT family transport system permease protein
MFSLLVIAGFFALWELAARIGAIDTQFIPAFTTVINEAWELLRTGDLERHIGVSMLRLFAGIVLAVFTALPLGFLLAGWKPKLAKFLNPLLVNLSLMNPFTLLPVFILLLGMGETSKIFIIYWVVLFPALFSTIAGINRIDPQLIKAARVMDSGSVKIFFDIILPGSVTRLFTGVKSAVTMGFTVLLGSEMLGARSGLGWIIFNSKRNYNIPRAYVGILFIAVTGVIVALLLDALQKRIVHWQEVI